MSRLRFNLDEPALADLARRGEEAVLSAAVPADLLTPLAAFLRIMRPGGHAFLLESVEGGSSLARYSFLGADACRVFRIRDGVLTVEEECGRMRTVSGDALAGLRRERQRLAPAPQADLPPLSGGLVGFFSYDLARLLERLPRRSGDDPGVPQAVLGEYRTVLAFDHLRNRLLLLTAVDLRGGADRRGQALAEARRALEELAERLAGPGPRLSELEGTAGGPAQVTPAEEPFRRQVEEARRQIRAGEIFQVVLSRRFQRPWSGSPLPIYRRLRSGNPSPYHFLLNCRDDCLVGASPEMLVRVQGDTVQVRPIAGTRPRGRHAEEDARLAEELLGDEKENAEHVMLVDLARNDVGRVSRAGTVTVDSFAQVERYSHVMHLVSSVQGRLREGADALDAFAACFPAGTLTGAPKVRAMEIIARSEPSCRGAYGGAVGYWDRSGDLDTCIAIRCVVITGGQAMVQAGAGIVADSDARRELREVASKARVGLAAVGGEGWDEP